MWRRQDSNLGRLSRQIYSGPTEVALIRQFSCEVSDRGIPGGIEPDARHDRTHSARRVVTAVGPRALSLQVIRLPAAGCLRNTGSQ
jgi:hypothetical protein